MGQIVLEVQASPSSNFQAGVAGRLAPVCLRLRRRLLLLGSAKRPGGLAYAVDHIRVEDRERRAFEEPNGIGRAIARFGIDAHWLVRSTPSTAREA